MPSCPQQSQSLQAVNDGNILQVDGGARTGGQIEIGSQAKDWHTISTWLQAADGMLEAVGKAEQCAPLQSPNSLSTAMIAARLISRREESGQHPPGAHYFLIGVVVIPPVTLHQS